MKNLSENVSLFFLNSRYLWFSAQNHQFEVFEKCFEFSEEDQIFRSVWWNHFGSLQTWLVRFHSEIKNWCRLCFLWQNLSQILQRWNFRDLDRWKNNERQQILQFEHQPENSEWINQKIIENENWNVLKNSFLELFEKMMESFHSFENH